MQAPQGTDGISGPFQDVRPGAGHRLLSIQLGSWPRGFERSFSFNKKKGCGNILGIDVSLFRDFFFLWFQLEVETFQKGKQKK